MKNPRMTPENTVMVIVSFEGPDPYSTAGGLGVRVQNLCRVLTETGYLTHLFFIGDPKLSGEEKQAGGRLVLHRWCQWISEYYPGGVYDGEEGKLADFTDSVPAYIAHNVIKPAVAENKMVVVLSEEWQTAEAMCRLSDILYSERMRNEVIIFWNANNTYSFHRINWGRLNYATTVTTISRYMKHIMERMGLNPLVIPNGIPKSLLHKVDDQRAGELKSKLGCDLLLCKIARWDADKRWLEAVEAVARLKDLGLKPLMIARGGREPYRQEVMDKAFALGLSVKPAEPNPTNPDDQLASLVKALPADIIDVRYALPLEFLALLYRAADATLANSGHEPFGIVGLEAMAAGGIVFIGSTGEDYSIPFVNSMMMDSPDPAEIVGYLLYLRDNQERARKMRSVARYTAGYYTWEAAIENLFGKLENQGRIQGLLSQNYKI
jgi:glycosyltransferase involved in cell wall biosynthesis